MRPSDRKLPLSEGLGGPPQPSDHWPRTTRSRIYHTPWLSKVHYIPVVMKLWKLTYKVAAGCQKECQLFPLHIKNVPTHTLRMASQGFNSEKIQPSTAVNTMGSLDQAESQTDRAVQQGVAGSLEVSEASCSSFWPSTLHYLQLPKPYHILGFKIMAYSHPRAQACLLGCILFLTVGTYNVITFLGGAGQQTAYLSDVGNIALYTVFCVFCFVAPAFLNYFGLRITLCFGGFGYAACASSL
jgi:hypothetical protein